MNRYQVTATNLFKPAWVLKRETTQRDETEAIRAVMCNITQTTGEPDGNWDVKAEVVQWKR